MAGLGERGEGGNIGNIGNRIAILSLVLVSGQDICFRATGGGWKAV